MNNTATLLFLCLIATSGVAKSTNSNAIDGASNYSADSTWRWGGIFGANFAQVAIGEYWAAGGLSSYSINTILNFDVRYKKKKVSFDNSINIGYGMIKQGEKSALSSQKWLKSDDKLELTSKLGYQIKGEKLSISGLINFISQAAPWFNYPNETVLTSNFLAPGYLVFGGGIDYKPNSTLSMFFAPISSGKITFVHDQNLADAGSFGVQPAERSESGEIVKPGARYRAEFGGFLRIVYKKENLSADSKSPLNDISFQSNIDLFSNYLNSPENIDINASLLLGMKVNKYISVTISANAIYDHDTSFKIIERDGDGNETGFHLGPRLQIKEVLGVGFSYKF